MDIKEMIKPVIDIKDLFIVNSDDGWVAMDEQKLAFIKPLWTSPESGGWSALFRWHKGYVAPAHKHLGAIHAYIISGRLGVRDHEMGIGDYTYESNGIIHPETIALEDTVHFNVADGPVLLYNDVGVVGVFGWEQVEAFKQQVVRETTSNPAGM